MENKRRKHFPDNNWFRQDASRNEELMEWNGVPHCSRNWIRRLGMTRLSKNFLSIYNLTDDEWPPNWMSHELGTACHELKISWTGCYRFYQHLSPIHRSLMKVWKSRKKKLLREMAEPEPFISRSIFYVSIRLFFQSATWIPFLC